MKIHTLLVVGLIMFLLSSCGEKSELTSSISPEPTARSLTPIRLPVGYIPNIQFAPLYVAIEKGFYRDAGLEVTVDYSMENDNAVLLATNAYSFAIISGEQVLLARDKDLPLVYVMAWYQQFPVGIASKETLGIQTVGDLRGKKIGLPGLFGASYIGMIALLDSAGLKESDVTLDSIGFNQVPILMADRDDAVVVYVANEPVQLSSLGQSIHLLKVSDALELVSNGLVTNEKTLSENPMLVKAMVSATLKGINYTIANPDEAYEISKKYVENLAAADQNIQKQILLNSIDQWKSDRMGYSQPVSWENMQRILIKMGLLQKKSVVTASYTNEFIP
ncbi:MAG: ABC transporter substrate-binding protein [Chloroflexi bacterium]|nr:ABC transporter substrate-binding protein [Chloroflexota bacterium]